MLPHSLSLTDVPAAALRVTWRVSPQKPAPSFQLVFLLLNRSLHLHHRHAVLCSLLSVSLLFYPSSYSPNTSSASSSPSYYTTISFVHILLLLLDRLLYPHRLFFSVSKQGHRKYIRLSIHSRYFCENCVCTKHSNTLLSLLITSRLTPPPRRLQKDKTQARRADLIG